MYFPYVHFLYFIIYVLFSLICVQNTYLNCPNTIQEVHFLGLLTIFKGDVVHSVNSFLRWVCIEPHLFILGKIDYLFELYTHKPNLTYISVTFTLSYTWVGYSQTYCHIIFELPSKFRLKCIYVFWAKYIVHLFILGKIDYLFEFYIHKPNVTYISVTFTLSYTWVGYSQTHSHLIFELPSKLCPLKCIDVWYSHTHSLVLFDPS